jgi:hypothetical protein
MPVVYGVTVSATYCTATSKNGPQTESGLPITTILHNIFSISWNHVIQSQDTQKPMFLLGQVQDDVQ